MKLANKLLNNLNEERKVVTLKKQVSDIAEEVESYIVDLRYNIKNPFELAVAYLESWNDAYRSGMSDFRSQCHVEGLNDKQMKDLWTTLESKFSKYRKKVGSTDDDNVDV